jgi:hypothetical protein
MMSVFTRGFSPKILLGEGFPCKVLLPARPAKPSECRAEVLRFLDTVVTKLGSAKAKMEFVFLRALLVSLHPHAYH